jgi:pathogenesis-related protein 1
MPSQFSARMKIVSARALGIPCFFVLTACSAADPGADNGGTGGASIGPQYQAGNAGFTGQAGAAGALLGGGGAGNAGATGIPSNGGVGGPGGGGFGNAGLGNGGFGNGGLGSGGFGMGGLATGGIVGGGGSPGQGGVSGAGMIGGGGVSGGSSGGQMNVGGMSTGDMEPGRLAGITAEHNVIRAMVTAQPMLPSVTWSSTVAAYAQQWADNLAQTACDSPRHRTGQELMAKNYGENLAVFTTPTGTSTAKQAVDGWAAEKMCWTYGTILGTEKCDSSCSQMLHSDGCGHYTAIVWRTSMQIGCGVATCQGSRGKNDIWICNYSPAGNIVGRAPY